MKITKKYTSSLSPNILFDAWTSEDMAIDPVTRIESNPKLGGHFILYVESEDFTSKMTGEFLEFDQNRKLKYTWIWEGSDELTEVTVMFEQNRTGCNVTIIHDGFQSKESLENHDSGWDSYFNSLECRLKLISENPFKKSELTTILVVSDIKKSKEFYCDSLGAELYREYNQDSAVIQFLGSWLLLVTEGDPTPDKPEVYFKTINDNNNVSHSFTIRVKDCEESYAILKSRGVKFITPPVVNGQETRCFFYDPDGHLFEISEYRAS